MSDDAMNASRRRFLQGLAAGTVIASTQVALVGCDEIDDETESTTEAAFSHNVASGDPQAESVVLWTRAVPTSGTTARIRYEVATAADFDEILASGMLETSAERDYTAKVDVIGLAPGQRYFYRFRAGETVSPVGQTKTLPTAEVDQVKVALFSCSNYPAGYFHAYREAAKQDDLDVCLHVGDYIYEYDRDGYASEDAAALGRLSEPNRELLSLADYRIRLAQYRSDTDLQELHRLVPFITVWDDHEVANDAYRAGAENHQPDEGSFFDRRDAALQAYFEWLPVREPTTPTTGARINRYQTFDFGNLLSLHVLETRLSGRDRQLDYANYIDPVTGAFNEASFTADISDANRQLLGAEQSAWLVNQLSASQATWQALGQQVLMGRMNLPAPLVTFQVSFSEYQAILVKAQTDPGGLTPQEQAILAQPSIPYNLDAWDGYAAARETIFETVRAQDKNLIALAGDTHNSWANNLRALDGTALGVEIAGTSVSSPGLEDFFTDEDPDELAAGVTQLIPDLYYSDLQHRGFVVVTFRADEVVADWYHLDTVKSRDYQILPERRRTLRVRPGAGNRQIEEV